MIGAHIINKHPNIVKEIKSPAFKIESYDEDPETRSKNYFSEKVLHAPP